MLFNPDEETGSAGSKQLIAELARQQDYVFSYEPPDRDAVTVATNGIDGLLLEVRVARPMPARHPSKAATPFSNCRTSCCVSRTSAIRRKAPR